MIQSGSISCGTSEVRVRAVPDTFYRYRSLRVVLFHSLILHILFRRIAPDNGNSKNEKTRHDKTFNITFDRVSKIVTPSTDI